MRRGNNAIRVMENFKNSAKSLPIVICASRPRAAR